MKNNEIIRRLLLQCISKNPSALIADIQQSVSSDLSFSVTENDIKAAVKWLARNGYIEVDQIKGLNGRFASCERKVIKFF